MKHTILMITMLAAVAAGAQITVTNATFPAVGDTLRTAIDEMPTGIVALTPPGGNQQWDFSSLLAGFTREQIIRPAAEGNAAASFPEAEYFIEIANGGQNYYNATGQRIELVGFSGEDPLGQGFQVVTRFAPPIIERRATLEFLAINQSSAALLFPFSPDDVPGDIFDQLPISPDSLRVRVAISRLDAVDGWGSLTIPGGTYDVLREKTNGIPRSPPRRQIPLYRLAGYYQYRPSVPPVPGLGVDTLVRYYYFNDEEKEPIAIATVNNEQNAVTSVEFKANNTTTPVHNAGNPRPGIYAYPNPAMVNVRFDFVNLPEGNYNLQFYDLLGKEVLHRRYAIHGNQTEKMDVSSLRPGVYLCSVTNNKGKIVATRRIAVVRP
ncbi:MAG: T9SS type A sorting domain-containing protein [Saprospiraceae bacterium]|nr:T9SS type A sorting domain-containing protein [Saprospiraceae bacterium]